MVTRLQDQKGHVGRQLFNVVNCGNEIGQQAKRPNFGPLRHEVGSYSIRGGELDVFDLRDTESAAQLGGFCLRYACIGSTLGYWQSC